MTHIETTCEEEKKARKDFKEVKPGDPKVADEKLEATVRELLALRRKMDEDELKASKLKAVIMNAMQNTDTLKSKSGVVLVSWTQGNAKNNVDYKGLLKKYKVTDEDIAAFTTVKVGSRVFSVEINE